MVDISKRLAALSTEKQALLLKRLKAAKAGSKLTRIPRQSREKNTFPLSFTQQRRWFLSQLEPESPAYNVWHVMEIEEGVSVAAIQATLAELVRRHEILRTIFPSINGDPVQLILEPQDFFLPLIDLREIEPPERSKELSRVLVSETTRPFDLIHGPILRTPLLQFKDDNYLLLLDMDHILVDGWSFMILLNEFNSLYVAYATGKTPHLEELEIQYADFAVWQREYLQGESYQKLLDYWKIQLEGVPKLLELPTDRPRPAVQTYTGTYIGFGIDIDLAERLRAFSHKEGVTLYMTLLTAFATLMYRYSWQETICIGTPIANRNRPELEKLIGCFINTLVMRIDLSGSMTLRELVGVVQQITLNAYSHQDMPFEKLVDEIKIERSLSHPPLFQVMFGLQNVPGAKAQSLDQNLTLVKDLMPTSKFDLELAAVESVKGEVGCGLQYNTDLFDDARVIRLVRHFQNLLMAFMEDPDIKLADISFIGDEERYQLLTEWNATEYDYSREKRVHELFFEHACNTPEKIAAVCGDQQLTYEELDSRSNRIAGLLIQSGVCAEDVVALLADRGIDFLLLILAIFKAGAAYLPLDPKHPGSRIRQVLEQSGARHLLVSEKYSGKEGLSEDQQAGAGPSDLNVMQIDTLLFLEGCDDQLMLSVEPQNLCYVIFTSGSTGMPKGAMVEHKGMLNHLYAKIKDLQLSSEDIVAQTASQCFDISVWQYFASLVCGGQVYIINDDDVRDPMELVRQVERGAVTVLETVPSLLRAFIQEVSASDNLRDRLSCLRRMVVTGEALPPELARDWIELYPEIELINAYGPTECSDDVTHYVVKEVSAAGVTHMPIGKAIINTEIYMLDDYFMPVPIGINGEVFVGGEGVGRGYLHDAQQTAEVFLPDPYSKTYGSRLYRTGDKGRYREDGNILFIERKDNQVKVRGYRIELGEIESVLLEHSSISEVAVIVREAGEEKVIVAYFVVRQNRSVDVGDLKAFAREKLPGYMVPTVFVPLTAMPLTANDKLDRSALPEPKGWLETTARDYIAPRTPTEEVLAGIWADILRVKQVGVYDNFFELGGHSLLATQVISRVRKAFQCEIRLMSLFERPTVADLSEFIDIEMRAGKRVQFQPILPAPRDGNLPLSYPQQRQWFLDQIDPGTGANNIPVAHRISGNLNFEALSRAVAEVVRRHEILRTVFTEIDGKPVQVIRGEHDVFLRVFDLSDLEGEKKEAEAMRLTASEAWRPFNLAEGPLMRVALVYLRESDSMLSVTMHHIITDGWSIGVLIDELTTLYSVFAADQPSPLPELTIQYADYAVWQQSWVLNESVVKDIEFWQNHLLDCPVLDLPTDRPRPLSQSFQGDREIIVLGPQLSQNLRAFSRTEGVTVFMTLLTVWQALLLRYSGQEEISIGSQIANRNRSELESLIGYFVNYLIFRTDFSGNPSFRGLLGKVRHSALDAYAHQEAPFEVVLGALNLKRDPSRAPLFQVMFTLQNFPEPRAMDSDVQVNPAVEEVAVGNSHRTNFDLNLLLSEGSLGLAGALDYATDLFDRGTIQRMVQHFITMMDAIIENPDQCVGELPLLGDNEQHQLLVERNRFKQENQPDGCWVEIVEEHSLCRPDALAITDGEIQLTYGELNARANQVAGYLQSIGVSLETRVAILMDRCVDNAVVILGVLKAGGTFISLDPGYSARHIFAVLEDSEALILFSHSWLVEDILSPVAGNSFSHLKNVRIIRFDNEGAALSRQSTENPKRIVEPDNLACISYAADKAHSPMGVRVSHRGLLNSCYTWNAEACFQTATLASDSFIASLLSALGSGAKLVICRARPLLSPSDLYDIVHNEIVDALAADIFLLRGLAHYLEENGGGIDLARIIITGEDRISIRELNRLSQAFGSETQFFKSFGRADAPVASLFHMKSLVNQRPENCAPIEDFAHADAYVLDRHFQMVPVGVFGELFVGASGLALGYNNNSDLTASRFIPHPFAKKQGERLYRTGNLARWLPDGVLYLSGYMEDHLRVRGIRVDTKMIEAVLSDCKGVLEVKVSGCNDDRGNMRLIAQVVPDRADALGVRELRQYCKKHLPAYLIPSEFIMANTIQTDGDALSPELPFTTIHTVNNSYVAPCNSIEDALVGIWESILDRKNIGVFDDFFALGGNSLLAVELVSQVRTKFEVGISLRSLFEAPTIADLASRIEQALSEYVREN